MLSWPLLCAVACLLRPSSVEKTSDLTKQVLLYCVTPFRKRGGWGEARKPPPRPRLSPLETLNLTSSCGEIQGHDFCYRLTYGGDNFVRWSGDAQNIAQRQGTVFHPLNRKLYSAD